MQKSGPYYRQIDQQLDKHFRRRIVHLILLIIFFYSGLLFASFYAGRTAALAIIPLALVAVLRVWILIRFLRQTSSYQVLSMYSSFTFHRTDPLRRHALLSRHERLSSYIIYSYSGLVAGSILGLLLLVISAAIHRNGFGMFLVELFVLMLATLAGYFSIELLYEWAVLEAVESIMSSRAEQDKYGKSKSEYLLQEAEKTQNSYLATRKKRAISATSIPSIVKF